MGFGGDRPSPDQPCGQRAKNEGRHHEQEGEALDGAGAVGGAGGGIEADHFQDRIGKAHGDGIAQLLGGGEDGIVEAGCVGGGGRSGPAQRCGPTISAKGFKRTRE